MARSGRDPSQFARDLLAHLRHLLVTQTTGEVPTTFVVTATDTARIQQQAQAVGAATLVRTIDELAGALTAVREGDDARMAVEIALLKAARPDLDPSTEGLLRRIERLEAQLAGGPPPAPAPTPPAPRPPAPERAPEPTPSTPHPSRPEPQAAAPAPPAPAPEPQAAAPEPQATAPEPPAPAPEPQAPATAPEPPASAPDPPPAPAPSEPDPPASDPPAGDLPQVQRIWPAVLDKLAEKAPALAATFDGARPIAFAGDDLTIGFPPDQPFNKRKAESPDRRQALIDAFAAVTGGPVAPQYVMLEEGEAAAAAAPPDTPAPGSGEIDEDELLERLKSEFDAEEVS
jgi:DNA polymerase-3 subunit gamma/tau